MTNPPQQNPGAPRKVVTFLTDDEGNPSSIRVLMSVAFIIAIALTVIVVFGWTNNPEQAKDLALYFLVSAFGGKSAQKFAEAMKAARS